MSPLSKFEVALRGLLALDMQELVNADAISGHVGAGRARVEIEHADRKDDERANQDAPMLPMVPCSATASSGRHPHMCVRSSAFTYSSEG